MKLHPKTSEAYRLLHNGSLAMGRAERQGIRVDVEYIKKTKAKLSRDINSKLKTLKETDFYKKWEESVVKEVNINSSMQLSNYLYKVLKIDPPKLTETGRGSVDEETISQLKVPELQDILRIRKLKKIRDTYLDQFSREQTNGYIHPFFNLHLVRTFRSSSDHPNFQNIPKRDEEAMTIVRKAIYPRPGNMLFEVDYSGLEVRISACYHKDETMLRYIKNPETDMHRDMMEQIFLLEYDGSAEQEYLRAATKNGFVFPQFYGDYFVNCADYLACQWGHLPNGIFPDDSGVSVDHNGTPLGRHLRSKGFKSIKSFQKHLERLQEDFWNNRFPEYAYWKRHTWNIYKRRGYVDMLTGFRCSGVMSKNDVTNYPIQGAAFHCLLWSFIELDAVFRTYGFNSRLVGQIHDAIIFDIDPAELEQVAELIQDVTTKRLPKAWRWIVVPLEVKAELCPVDASWAEKEKYILT